MEKVEEHLNIIDSMTNQNTIYPLDYFIQSGQFYELKKRIKFSSLNLKGKLIPSNILDENGKIKYYDYVENKVRVGFGLDKNDFVDYILLYPKKYENRNIYFTINEGKIDLKSASFEEIINYLDQTGLSWQFKDALDKVVVIQIQSNEIIELLFDFDSEDPGLYCIQIEYPRNNHFEEFSNDIN